MLVLPVVGNLISEQGKKQEATCKKDGKRDPEIDECFAVDQHLCCNSSQR
jgi:hypothetical protein